ncbi:hypothetical protein D3C87_1867360 [compost metagenome]
MSVNVLPVPLASAWTAESLSAAMLPVLLNTCVAPARVTPLLSAHPPEIAALLLTLTDPPCACASIPDDPVPLVVIAPELLTVTLAAPEASARMPWLLLAPSVWIAPVLVIVCCPVVENVRMPCC